MSAFTDEDYRRVLNERDEAREERDLARERFENAVQSATRYAVERDEWRDKFYALNQTAGELCNACGWAFKIPGESCRCEVIKERDEAIRRITEVGVMVATNGNLLAKDAYRRGAEAMREACAAALMAYGLVLSRERAANVVRAQPIPEEP